MITQLFTQLAPNQDRKRTDLLLRRLLQRYNESNRHYHNLLHLESGLEENAELFGRFSSTKQQDIVWFFAWAYHDVVYDPMANDNEARSAAYFMDDSRELGISINQADEIAMLILSTDHRGEPNLITDLDLSVLGFSPEEYLRYTENIRKEYSFLQDSVFNAGRVKVLKQLLERPSLYFTSEAKSKYETPAKYNLANEIAERLVQPEVDLAYPI